MKSLDEYLAERTARQERELRELRLEKCWLLMTLTMRGRKTLAPLQEAKQKSK
jgi:hypothetical protein